MFLEIDEDKKINLLKEGLLSKTTLHEIKSPLALITANVQIALELNDPAEMKLVLGKIHHQATLIDDVIIRMRTIFNGSVEIKDKINLSSTICHLIEDHQKKIARDKIKIHLNLSNELEVEGHPDLLKHVFLNLLENAIHAIRNLEDRWIKIRSQVTKNYLHIYFIDSGTIDPSISEKIFNPLFTTKGHQGTGIGLFLVQEILLLHNAGIRCSVNEDGFTQFEMLFPRPSSI